MANDDHIALPKKGVDAWNAWRHENYNIYPDLSGANLRWAHLKWAHLDGANLSGANLEGANLQTSTVVETDLTDADLTGCRIYGISTWDRKLDRAKQQNLMITPENEPVITVDNIEIAQFRLPSSPQPKDSRRYRHYHLQSGADPRSLHG